MNSAEMMMKSALTDSHSPDKLVDAADKAFRKSGAIPIPIADVALEAGVSRALVYSRFATLEGIINAVLNKQVAQLEPQLSAALTAPTSLDQSVRESLVPYYRHLRDHGGILHAVSQDQFMSGLLSRRYRRFRDSNLKKLARLAKDELGLPIRMAIAQVILLASLAEEAARNVHKRPQDDEAAERLMLQAAQTMINSLRPAV